ncbi:MAG: LamG-like jellyroll fold domain-containing protein, partial [Pirellulales bacterium]
GGGKVITGGSAPVDEWTHIALTFDDPTGTMRLLVDGVLINSETGASSTASANFEIGRRPGFTSTFFDGRIDDVAIFDHVLTQQQLNNVITFGAANFAVPEPGSLALAAFGVIGVIALMGVRRRRKSVRI